MFNAESRLLPAAVPIAGLLEFLDKEAEAFAEEAERVAEEAGLAE